MTVHWYLSNKSYNELQAGLLDFMNNAIETGLIDRIEEKYFRHITAFDYVDTQAYLEAVEKILPQYQPLFEKYKGNLDWRLLALWPIKNHIGTLMPPLQQVCVG